MRFSLRLKTIVGTAIIEAALLVVLIVTAVGYLASLVDENLTKRARTTVNLFATTTKDAVLSFDLASLDTFADELMKNPDITYVQIWAANQALLTERGDTSTATESAVDTSLSTVNDGVFDVTAPIVESNVEYGAVAIGISIDATQQAISRVKVWSMSIAAFELILVAVFSFGLGTYLTNQLKGLQKGARNVRSALITGEFSNTHVKVSGNDEVSDVAKSFNKLITSLMQSIAKTKKQQQELENLNLSLDQKVEERTAELLAKNEELVAKNREIKEAQQQLLHAEKMASVGQLAAGVAHEINNPIGFVISNLSTLNDYISVYRTIGQLAVALSESEQSHRDNLITQLSELLQREDLDFVNQDLDDLMEESNDGLKRVAEIVSGLKLFSRADIDAKQMFNLNDCVKTTLNMVSNELKYHCEVETQLSALPEVPVNVGQITQVLTNLMINAGHAIQATNTFGKILVSSYVKNKFIHIDVADNGAGITKDDIKKIFNPFFTTKAEGQGTGLGLSISLGIMADHGGQIEVESKIGKGTTFSLIIPIGMENKIGNQEIQDAV